MSPQAHTVEVLRLASEGMHTVGIDGAGIHVHSEVLEGLALPVDEVFVLPHEDGEKRPVI